MPATRIIYIHHERALGGAPVSLLYLLQQLDRTKYQASVVCLREGPAADLFRKNGFSVQIAEGPDLSHTELVWFRFWQFPRLAWRILFSIPLYFKLKKVLVDLQRDPSTALGMTAEQKTIVHLNSSTLLTAALAAKSLGLPLVWHIREPLAKGYVGIRRFLLRKAICGLPDQIIAISQNDATQVSPEFTAHPEGERKLIQPQTNNPLSLRTRENLCKNLTVIYNFVDFKRFDINLPNGTIKKELNLPADSILLTFLGGDSKVKGAYVLLQSTPKIFEKVKNAQIVIAGETSERFQSQINDLPSQLRDHIHLLGPREDIPEILADTSILLFPSIVPHFARPVIEAAAMGKPVVASDIPGVQELIVRNETGLLVHPNDPQALADAIVDLVNNQDRAFRFGQQAHVLAKKKFNAEVNAKETFKIYEKLLLSSTSP
jgi:glycosyltransferase involved in cell wall biosynthesis